MPLRSPTASRRDLADAIGVFRQQQHLVFAARNVRPVNTGIRQDHTEAVLHDDHPGPAADHSGGFAQYQFHHARVFVGFCREPAGVSGRFDSAQVHGLALDLGDDFLGNSQHVPLLQGQARVRQRRENDAGEIIAGHKQRQAAEAEKCQVW